MYKIVVHAYGDADQLKIEEHETPRPEGARVLVKLTSIGMNHAELMARRGQYKIASGDPPFTPGLEAGGIVEACGPDVTRFKGGERVILDINAPRQATGGGEGTYASHYLTDETLLIPAADELPEEQLGAVWLPYLTAWGCLVWKQQVQSNDTVLLPAASSSVAIAASQLLKDLGCTTIGTTTSPEKVDILKNVPAARYDHLLLTGDQPWHQQVKRITGGHYCDVIFDPVGAGEFLNREVRCLARGGTLWIYGLLGKPDTVDLSPLIRKGASVRGWALTELAATAGEPLQAGYDHILTRIADGRFQLPVAQTFPLRDVQRAHREMEKGEHIGKLILIP